MKKFFIIAVICLLVSSVAFAVSEWTQLGGDIDGEAADDESGFSVSMSSDGLTVAIGAVFNDGSFSGAGHVRIYELIAGVWEQKGADIDGEAASDFSGISVSMSSDGDTVAIGASQNTGSGSTSGHVRIYEFIANAWEQKGADIDGGATGDNSGGSVSMSSDGDTVAIGAIFNDGSFSNAGHVRIYEFIANAWEQKGADIDGEAASDESGGSVSMSSDGDTVAIGASKNNDNGFASGHVRIYEFIANAWEQKGADIDGEAAFDNSGGSVSMSSDGDTVAIGASQNNGNGSASGHVRIYEFIANAWEQKGADIDGEAASDNSGGSVSMSSDGDTVAIGSTSNDGSFSNAGHVRIYEFIANSWEQKGADIGGEAAGDFSGYSVSMSSDGDTVAIGARENDGNGSNSGHTRIYSFLETSSEAGAAATVAVVRAKREAARSAAKSAAAVVAEPVPLKQAMEQKDDVYCSLKINESKVGTVVDGLNYTIVWSASNTGNYEVYLVDADGSRVLLEDGYYTLGEKMISGDLSDFFKRDYLQLANQWVGKFGSDDSNFDLNSDGIVNIADFAIFYGDWVKDALSNKAILITLEALGCVEERYWELSPNLTIPKLIISQRSIRLTESIEVTIEGTDEIVYSINGGEEVVYGGPVIINPGDRIVYMGTEDGRETITYKEFYPKPLVIQERFRRFLERVFRVEPSLFKPRSTEVIDLIKTMLLGRFLGLVASE